MRLARRLVTGRKAWSQPNFWSLDDARLPLLASYGWPDRETIENNFEGYVQGAYKSDGVVFAVILARMMLFTEARFLHQEVVKGRPGDLYDGGGLELLDKPWRSGTTGELLARMEQDVSLAGNAYVTKVANRLVRLRPDWVQIVIHSASGNPHALDAEVAGYIYKPPPHGGTLEETILLPDQVCHFSPIPDPIAHYRGMSWLTPVLRDIEASKAATEHKARFFSNAATPSMVVRYDKDTNETAMARFIELYKASHQGVENAYKTLFLAGGADVTPLTHDFRQLDFKSTTGTSETHIASAAGVPSIIVGLSEGMAAQTYSNFHQARRHFANHWARPQWRMVCAALSTLVNVPDGSRLWFDDRDIAFLQEDARDAAEIQGIHASTINTLVTAGFKPDVAARAVMAGDLSQVAGEHTGLFSVQLIPAGAGEPQQTPSPEDG